MAKREGYKVIQCEIPDDMMTKLQMMHTLEKFHRKDNKFLQPDFVRELLVLGMEKHKENKKAK